MKKAALCLLLALCVSVCLLGCVTATATHTQVINGSTNTDKVSVSGFLESISNGQYSSSNSSGSSVTLSTVSTTPDQQSIAILSGAVVDLSKAAFAFASKAPTNNPAPAKP